MGNYTTTQLLATLQALFQTPRFLRDLFFPASITFDTEQVAFDIEAQNLRLAPFVSPLIAGKAIRARGHSTKFFKPAYVKPKHQVDPTMPLVRRAGEAFGGAMSAAARRDLIIAQLLADQRDMVTRREEWMASQILTTGAVTVSGDDYPEVEVDYDRHTDLTKTLTSGDRWGETGVKPSKNIDTWCDLVASKCGAGVNVVIMGKDAWGYLAEDAAFQKMLDRTLGQNGAINLGFKAGDPGAPIYKGSVGDLAFYTYSGTYEDDAGDVQNLLDPLGVILAAVGAVEGLRLYGAILDGSAGYQAAEIWPKQWIENDPGVEFVMSQSAPLLVPKRPNATMYVKVR